MRYSAAGLGGVFDAVNVGATVGRDVDVAVGGGRLVSVGLGVLVAVGKSGITVTPGTGVRVGILGTHSNCPA